MRNLGVKNVDLGGISRPSRAVRSISVTLTGLITTDWLPSASWVGAANAGSDVMGGADPGAVGFSVATFTANVPAARIDDAVRRVLRQKFQLGLIENPLKRN